MSAQTCIVQLGRYGDLVNILPCARDIALKEGGKCAVMVSAEFASVLEGCSYVDPIVVSTHFTDSQPAIEQAKRMFPRVLVAKVSEKAVGVTTQCESFNQESWRQIGMLNDWFRLPLVFDKRDRAREERLIEQVSHCGKPMILVNFSGKSAPFEMGDAIKRVLPSSRNVVDLGSIRAHRIYDLLGLMDNAEFMVTCDTSTLHLAAASGVPVVNLIGDKPIPWHGSKPRNNDIMSIRYSKAGEYFVGCKSFDVTHSWRPRTWHVWSDYVMTGDTLRRHKLAKLTWQNTGWIPFPVTENKRVMNDPMRSVPFIKDLINAAVYCAGPRDIIVLTNADSCINTAAPACVAKAVEERGCCYSFRRDFPYLARPLAPDEVMAGHQYAGCDLFAFSVKWWNQHQNEYPDMVLAAEVWDWTMRRIMNRCGGVEFNHLVYHEKHPTIWEDEAHRYSLPSQKHNRTLVESIA